MSTAGRPTAQQSAERRQLRRRLLLSSPAMLMLVLFLVIPLGIMFAVSIQQSGDYGGVKWGQHSLEAYLNFLWERDLDDSLVFNADYLGIFQRITLEHRVDRAAERRQAFHVFAIEADAAGTGLFEAGDEAEEGGLAAAGRAEEGEEFVGVDIQGHIVKGLQALAGGTEFHADPLDGYRAGHAEFHAVKQLLLLRFCGFWGPLHLLRFDNDRGAAGAER